MKWLIEAQIAGVDSLNFDPARGSVQAPWLSWGPYLWADGLSPRSDGFTWACSSFQSDGTHPSAQGQTIVADSLLAFFSHDDTATPWFLNSATTSAPVATPGLALAAVPNPSRGTVALSFAPDRPWRVAIVDASGRRVRELGAGATVGETVTLSWDGRDGHGRRVAAGVYWARLEEPGRATLTTRLIRD